MLAKSNIHKVLIFFGRGSQQNTKLKFRVLTLCCYLTKLGLFYMFQMLHPNGRHLEKDIPMGIPNLYMFTSDFFDKWNTYPQIFAYALQLLSAYYIGSYVIVQVVDSMEFSPMGSNAYIGRFQFSRYPII